MRERERGKRADEREPRQILFPRFGEQRCVRFYGTREFARNEFIVRELNRVPQRYIRFNMREPCDRPGAAVRWSIFTGHRSGAPTVKANRMFFITKARFYGPLLMRE